MFSFPSIAFSNEILYSFPHMRKTVLVENQEVKKMNNQNQRNNQNQKNNQNRQNQKNNQDQRNNQNQQDR